MNEKELMKMNTNRNLFYISLPIFVELLLQLLVGNIDQIMIGRYSQESVAAIVNGNQVMNLVIIVLNMISMATTVILSQYLGAKDKSSTSKTCMISLLLITAISILITMAVLGFCKSIFVAMNVQADILAETTLYLYIVGGFILVQGLYLNFAAILRTFTFMKEVMMVSIIMNILHIFGNAILINGWFMFPEMGVAGAAISTVISKIIGLFLIILLFRKKVDISLNFTCLQPFPTKILKNLCGIALPSGMESLSYNMSQMVILSFVNMFGTMVTVTKGYCSILANFSYVYAIALAQASQIVLGYLLGVKMLDAIEKRTYSTMKIAIGICLSLSVVLFVNSSVIMSVFSATEEMKALGHRILFWECFLEFGRALNIWMTRALITLGDAKTPMVVGISGHWFIACAFSYILGVHFGLGLEGIWIAMALDECTRGIIYLFTFRTGKWKNRYCTANVSEY